MQKIIIIGPAPPSIGGISTIVELLKQGYAGNKNVEFINTNKPGNRFLIIFHPILLLFKISSKAIKEKNSTVLMFSSAYRSFWEKCVWAMVCNVFGLRTVMLMVDGNFPGFFSGKSKLMRKIALIMIKNVHVLAVQSNQWKVFYENIFPFTNVKIINPGIDTDFFQPVKSSEKNDDVNILYVGWLIKEKGVYDLLKAMQIVKSHNVKCKLILLGPDFGQKNKITDFAVKLEIDDLLEFAKPTSSREVIRKAYLSADVFVFPSHYEGFPYALMEAISCGLPCIATRVGGIPDILDGGKCGILVDPQLPEELANRLLELISDEEYRITLSKQARYRASKEYSLLKSFTGFKEVLNANDWKNKSL